MEAQDLLQSRRQEPDKIDGPGNGAPGKTGLNCSSPLSATMPFFARDYRLLLYGTWIESDRDRVEPQIQIISNSDLSVSLSWFTCAGLDMDGILVIPCSSMNACISCILCPHRPSP